MNDQCLACGGACCRDVVIACPNVDAAALPWMETRGPVVDGEWILPCACKHLTLGLCGIYDDRPAGCKDYRVDGADCRATRARGGVA